MAPIGVPGPVDSPGVARLSEQLNPEPLRWIVLPVILALATFLRFLSLPNRGIFDADQGRDFLVLRAMLVDGVIPLVGPPASVGGVHHGVVYYYLLAPVAWASSLDPTVVATLFAAAGVGAVAIVWWLARSIGGPTAGLVAGLIFALSPTAISASITNWNPNLIPIVASFTLAAAWKAWQTRRARWWLIAVAATGLTVQLHIAALLLVPPVAGLLVADLRRTPPGPHRQVLLRAVGGGLALAALLFVPLLIHELTTGFSEVRAAIAYLGSDRGPAAFDPLSRLLIVTLRIASWPVVGLLIDAPIAASLLTGLVIAFCVWRLRAATGDERVAIRWLVSVLVIGAVGLTILVPDLSRVVRGLPNDHYHAFTDPVIAIVLGLGVAAIVGPRGELPPARRRLLRAEQILVSAGLIVILVFELIRLPPRADPDGGWPAALSAAERIARDTPAQSILVVGLPDFKPTGGVLFPLLQVGRHVIDGNAAAEGTQAAPTGPAGVPDAMVVVCDRLFEPVMPEPCGGPAESAVPHADYPLLVDRFDLSPRTSITVYARAGQIGL